MTPVTGSTDAAILEKIVAEDWLLDALVGTRKRSVSRLDEAGHSHDSGHRRS